MRLMTGCAMAVVLCLGAGLSAEDKKDEKIDAKKLIGKWESKEKKEKFAIEFTKDGKLIIDTDSKKEGKVEGTYKLDGNKLEVAVKIGDMEHKMIRTVSKLTDTELVSADEKGKEDTLVRVKGK